MAEVPVVAKEEVLVVAKEEVLVVAKGEGEEEDSEEGEDLAAEEEAERPEEDLAAEEEKARLVGEKEVGKEAGKMGKGWGGENASFFVPTVHIFELIPR